ncbi:MAG TPA: DUF1207 domain-containing protein, partial [bacterium]|nr:DUF1207 domain-containing protein [bacterium]
TFILFLGLSLGSWRSASSQESSMTFSPAGHVFAPLLADPREPNTSLAISPDLTQYDGALGGTVDLLRWTNSDDDRWAWGAWGGGYLSILRYSYTQQPFNFRLEDIDLWVGTYVSESSGLFSNRLAFLHGTSHLGDYYFFSNLQPISYARDGLQFTDSFQPSDLFRLYGGLDYWLYADPLVPSFFVQLGTEIYTYYSHFDGNLFRGFFAYDLKIGNEVNGVLDQNFELGIQLKGSKENSTGIRLAVLYYNGNDLYGQFYGQSDNHWSFGFFVDP